MPQRLAPLNLDFSSFSRASSRMVDAARIAAEGDAALGRGIQDALTGVGRGIANKRQEAREDQRRAEDMARSDSLRREALARQDEAERYARERQAQLDQQRRDEGAARILRERIEAMSAQAAGAQFLAQGPDGTTDPAALAGVEALTENLRKTKVMLSIIENRMYGVGANGRPLGRGPAVGEPGFVPMPGESMESQRKRNDAIRGTTLELAADKAARDPGLFKTGGGGAPPAAPAAAPQDGLGDALARAEALRIRQRQLNAYGQDAMKDGRTADANKFFDAALLAGSRARVEESAAKQAQENAEKAAREQEAAAALAAKRGDARKSAESWAARYKTKTGKDWGGDLSAPDAAEQIKYDLTSFNSEEGKARSLAARREDATVAFNRKKELIAAAVSRGDAKEATRLREEHIKDAEQTLSNLTRIWSTLKMTDPEAADTFFAERVEPAAARVEEARKTRTAPATRGAAVAPPPPPAPTKPSTGGVDDDVAKWLRGR